MLNTFTFNGHSSDEFGIMIERMPTLNRSARKFIAESVPGHNGNIYELQDAFEEVVQPYQIFAGDRNSNAVTNFSAIAEWLHSADGYAVLTDTYDPTHYREAIFVDSMDIESEWHTLGRTTINFRCRPEHYIITDPVSVSSGEAIYNSTNHIALPKITLTGDGAKNSLQLSGKTVKHSTSAQFGAVSYLSDLIPNMNTNVWRSSREANQPFMFYKMENTGDNATFDDTTGALTFNTSTEQGITEWGIGYLIKLEPNTAHTLSWEAYNGGIVSVYLGETTSTLINDSYTKGTSGSGWVADSLTFEVEPEYSYAFIIFGATSGKSTQQYRSIMLNLGDTAQTFKAYDSTPTRTAFSIGSNELLIDSNGYETIEIDCENEDVKIDGVYQNRSVTVQPKFNSNRGQRNAEFPYLQVGENTLTFSGANTAVVDPRMWVL